MSKRICKGIEGKARILLDLLSDPAVIVDGKGNFLIANDVFEEVTGLSRKELIGKPFFELIIVSAESKAVLLENLKKRLQGTQVEPYEVCFTGKAGENRCVEVKGKRVSYAGQPANLVVFHDVTRRRENEQRLKQYAERMETIVEEKVKEIKASEAKFRGIIDSALDAMFMFDEEGTIAYWNPAAEKIFGYSEEGIVGKRVNETIIPLRVRKGHLNLAEKLVNVKETAQTGQIWEFSALRKDGAEFSVELSMAPLQLNGEIYFIAIARDTTDRKKAEEIVRDTEQRYRHLFNTIPSGVAVYESVNDGTDFAFVDFNQAAVKIEKTQKQDILGRRVTEVFPGVKELGLLSVFQRVYRTGQEEYLPSGIYKDGHIFGWRENWVYKLPNDNIVSVYNDVTEKKKAEENLVDNEEKLRRIFESSPNPIAVSSSDAKIIDCNPAALKAFGYSTKSEVVGRSVFDFFAEKERARVVENLAHPGENSRNVEYILQARNGREFPGELSTCPVLLPSGEVTCFVSTIKDLTERKEKEKALRESEERFKQVAENAEEWIWEVDTNGTYTYSSPLVEKILGYTPEEIVGKKHFYDLFQLENRESLKEMALKAFEQKQMFHSFINMNVHKNGEAVWLSTSGVPILDQQGNLVGYRGTDTNITEFKMADEALRMSEAKYRELINGMNDTAWVIDLESKFIDVNEAAVKVLGYSREELLSMGPADIDNSLSAEEISKLVKNMPAAQVQVFETAHTTKNGKKIPVEISSSLVTYQGKQAVLSIARDITERVEMRKKIEEYAFNLEKIVAERTDQLKVANEQLLKSQRLAAIGELAGMVGHDLRNPLTGIKNAAYFLRKKGAAISETQSKDMLETIDKCVENSNKIINDLLDYSREMSLEMLDVSPRQLLTEALALMSIPERIKVLSNVPESPHIKAEPDKMKRVFVNIIKNAIDAIPERGTLTIACKQLADNLEFSFADTGSGIPEEILPKLFSPLFTTKAQGMGFGLAICRRIVEAHQGTIAVETSQGKGSTFKITIPIEQKLSVEGEKEWMIPPESSSPTMTKAQETR